MSALPKSRLLAVLILSLVALALPACGGEGHSGHDHGPGGHEDEPATK